MTFLSNTELLHKEFIETEGLGVLDYFLTKQDQFFVYTGVKVYTLLSRVKVNMVDLSLLLLYTNTFYSSNI